MTSSRANGQRATGSLEKRCFSHGVNKPRAGRRSKTHGGRCAPHDHRQTTQHSILPSRPPAHLPRRARASLRMARPRRPQAHHRPRRAFARGSRSRLIHRPQHLRPLPLVALDLGRALATRLRPRRPHLPTLRRPAPTHRATHRFSRRARGPQPPRPTHQTSTARACPLTRTARFHFAGWVTTKALPHHLAAPTSTSLPAV